MLLVICLKKLLTTTGAICCEIWGVVRSKELQNQMKPKNGILKGGGGGMKDCCCTVVG